MNTKELKKQLHLHYCNLETDRFGDSMVYYGKMLIATISEEREYDFQLLSDFFDLSKSDQRFLLNRFTDYVNTPLKERKQSTKFRLSLYHLEMGQDNLLLQNDREFPSRNFQLRHGEYRIGSVTDNPDYMYTFKRDEYNKLPQWIHKLVDCGELLMIDVDDEEEEYAHG